MSTKSVSGSCFCPTRLKQAMRWCVVCVLIWSAAAQGGAKVGSKVPDFVLRDQYGNEVSLQQQQGKVVMINFWATWCLPCVKELPSMQALKLAFADKPFEILAINMGEDEAVVNSFIEKIGIDFSFPVLFDADGWVAATYRVSSLPATMLVNRNGEFVFGGVGERDWNADAAKQEILPLFE